MKKLNALTVCFALFVMTALLLSAGTAKAATIPVSEDFDSGSLGSAELEENESGDWDYNDPDSDGDYQAFVNDAGSRDYIRTVDSNYNNVDFRADATINLANTGDGSNDVYNFGYFGLGDGVPDPDAGGVPTTSVNLMSRPNGKISLQLRDDGSNNELDVWDDPKDVWGYSGGTPNRVRMTKTGKDLTFAIEMDWSGSGFTADHTFSTLDLSDGQFSHLDTSTSRLFVGTGADDDGTAYTSIDDFNAVPEPGSLALLLFGSLALFHRRSRRNS